MIELKSVGSFVDKEGMIYPAFIFSKTPDLHNGCSVLDAPEEWLESLSVEDRKVVQPFLDSYQQDLSEDEAEKAYFEQHPELEP
ncbi:MAG: hypothetical protein ABGX83_05445 [Nitrospira sp.]